MTGPEHFHIAEKYLEVADAELDEYGAAKAGSQDEQYHLDQARFSQERAQVHATLALAAATALNPSRWPGAVNDLAWAKAAGEQGDAANVYRGGE